MRGLDDIRKEIDALDEQIIRLFVRRMDAAGSAAAYKLKAHEAVYRPEREKHVLEHVESNVPDELKNQGKSLFRTLMRIARQSQYAQIIKADRDWELGKRIAEAYGRVEDTDSVVFAGNPGSYAAQASTKLFPHAKVLEAGGFEQACQMAENGTADAAVLPFDNTTAGSVHQIDTLLQKYRLSIFRSTVIPIEHTLMGVPGAKLEQIREIRSHPQGLMQCAEIIKNMGWSAVPMENTAFAAEYVARTKDPTIAAIASEEAARMYGLDVLKPKVNDTDLNQTRFVAVRRKMTIPVNASRVSLAFILSHTSGSLAQALAVFADAGLNLVRIQSVPLPEAPWEYCFYLDFTAPAMDSAAMTALYQMDKEAPFLYLMGWYEEI